MLFELVKEKISITEAISKLLGQELKQVGTNTFTTEDDSCPFCQHRECFRISEDKKMWKCFSEDISGDVITFAEKALDKKPREAALHLAKEFNIVIPSDYSPVQDIFNTAAHYYHTCLMECKTGLPELNGLTPLEYQLTVRSHTLETITALKIGWSDGGLKRALDSLGFEESLVINSGLLNKKETGDFLPGKAFIYPHFVGRNRVSHFTFKDPLKLKEYQLTNKSKLNGHMFYGQHTLLQDHPVICLVEGENDWISMIEAGWDQSIIASIGMLSGGQVDWLVDNLAGKKLVTIFDTDTAGDKYREKIEKVKKKFKEVIHVKLQNVKDIDEFLKKGGTIDQALSFTEISEAIETNSGTEGSDDAAEKDNSNLVERDGAYYKIRYKDGVPIYIKLTNFTVILKNILVLNQTRGRQIIIVREDGARSKEIKVSSETKVSLKSFRVLIADAVDASFYGREEDLTLLWDFIYCKAKQIIIDMSSVVGRSDKFGGWLFKNCFISDSGKLITADKDGIIWMGGDCRGLMPISLSVSSSEGTESTIPILNDKYDMTEAFTFSKQFAEMLSQNMGNVGITIIMLAWIKSVIYSDYYFARYNSFPFLYFWGTHSKGKTIISQWLLNIYGMEESGYATFAQLGSVVGMQRKMAYYSSLPVLIDEFRANKDAIEVQTKSRSWFNRSGRILGVKEDFGIKQQEIKSCIMFAGEDLFTDPAARQRCIPVRIPANGRETVETYKWILANKHKLSSIGYLWLMESSNVDKTKIIEEIDEAERNLRIEGCDQRISKNWAIVKVFGGQIRDQYFPDFDLDGFLKISFTANMEEQTSDNMINQFFRTVEGMQAESPNPRINQEHILVEEDLVYLWWGEIVRQVQRHTPSRDSKEEFSTRALLSALREEPYFISDDKKKRMGTGDAERRVVILDLSKATDTIKSIGNFRGTI